MGSRHYHDISIYVSTKVRESDIGDTRRIAACLLDCFTHSESRDQSIERPSSAHQHTMRPIPALFISPFYT